MVIALSFYFQSVPLIHSSKKILLNKNTKLLIIVGMWKGGVLGYRLQTV